MRALTLTALFFATGCSSKSADTDAGAWWDSTSGTSGEADDEDDEDDEAGRFFWGEVSDDFSAVGYFSSDGSSLLCDEEYAAITVEAVSDCDACSTAYALVLGAREVYEELDTGCSDSPYGDLSNTTFRVGEGSGVLYIDRGSGWSAIGDSTVEVEGSSFFFGVGGADDEDA